MDNSYKEDVNWKRGGFFGKIVHIFVSQGKIIDKVFLTYKGNIISVKRSELGLIFGRLF